MLLQDRIKAVAKVGFGLSETVLSNTLGKANKVLLHGESVSLPPGLAGLPKNLSDIPVNLLTALPDLIARWAKIASFAVYIDAAGVLKPSVSAAVLKWPVEQICTQYMPYCSCLSYALYVHHTLAAALLSVLLYFEPCMHT